MKKISLLFVVSDTENSKNFLNIIFRLLDYETYSVSVLSLGDEYLPKNENVQIKDFSNSYLDSGFLKGFFKCIKDKKTSYIPILIKEKLTKTISKEDRINFVDLEGKYRACVSVDLNCGEFVADRVTSRLKIQRFPYGKVETPYLEDFEAFKKFNYFVVLDDAVKEPFAHAYEIPEEKIKLIPNIIDIPELKKSADETQIKREAKYVFTSLCRLASLSQIDFIIDTAKELIKRDFRDFVWHVVSGRSDIHPTKIKIEKEHLNRHIRFYEKQQNPYPFIKACDIYCQVSDIEAEAITLNQAILLSKKCLAVESEEVHTKGVLLSKKDPAEFAEKIIDMCQNWDNFPLITLDTGEEEFIKAYTTLFEKPKKKEENEEETIASDQQTVQ
ncbi:MAG: glycosyltransferase [Abditibacteriota bacterium]|nr:glycosyltransferase [Abditibacteriota bacterium]